MVRFQDLVGRLVLQQFLKGVLHHALGEDFGRVVGRALLAVAAGQAVDKRPLRIPFGPSLVVIDDFLFGVVLRQVARRERSTPV